MDLNIKHTPSFILPLVYTIQSLLLTRCNCIRCEVTAKKRLAVLALVKRDWYIDFTCYFCSFTFS